MLSQESSKGWLHPLVRETTLRYQHYWFLMIVPIQIAFAGSRYGSICGEVRDAITDEKLVAVRVNIKGINLWSLSGLDGRFCLDSVPPGVRTLVVSHPEYGDVEIADLAVSGGEILTKSIRLQPSTSGQRSLGILIGQVLHGETGKPIAGVAILARGVRSGTFTDENGNYSLVDIPAGTYTLTASHKGFDALSFEGVMIEGNTVNRCDFRLMPRRRKAKAVQKPVDTTGGYIAGHLIDSVSRKPVVAALVSIPGSGQWTRSDLQGAFKLGPLAPGVYTPLVTLSGYEETQLGEITVGSNSVVELNVLLREKGARRSAVDSESTGYGTLRGNVRETVTRRPLYGATLLLEGTTFSAVADSSGQFALDSIPPSTYTLTAHCRGYDATVRFGLKIEAGITTTIDLSLTPKNQSDSVTDDSYGLAGTITGRLVNAQSGAPLSGIVVIVSEINVTDTTDADGVYMINAIPPTTGVYTIYGIREGSDTLCRRQFSLLPGDLLVENFIIDPSTLDPDGAEVGGATLAGVVYDKKNGMPIAGVRVSLGRSRYQTNTDANGAFHIRSIRPGSYNLEVTRDGFVSVLIPEIVFSENQAVKRDFFLESSDINEMQRLVVTGQAVRNTDASLLRERKMSFSVSDAISAAEISRSGAGNVADALKQVTGVTVLDGKYVVIRGLSDRYVNTTLNGMVLPSPDPDKRAVPLDMFPTALMDNIVTNKSFTADKPGDFAGGNVNIVTNAVPQKRILAISAKGGMDGRTFQQKSFLTYSGGKLDWIGIDDGTRGLPFALAAAEKVPHATSARTNAEEARKLDELTKSFIGEMVPHKERKVPDVGFGALLADRIYLKGSKLGGLLSLTYSSNQSYYENGVNSRYGYSQKAELGEYSELAVIRAYTEDRASRDILWGGLAATTFEPAPHQTLNLNYLYVHNAEDDVRYAGGRIANLEAGRIAEYYSILYSERNLSTFQLIGLHRLPLNMEFDWRMSPNWTKQNQPDQRIIMLNRYVTPDPDVGYDYRTHENILPVKNPERYFRTLHERSLQASGDLSVYPFGFDERNWTIRLGATVFYRKRDYRVKRYFYTVTPGSGVSLNATGGPEHYFDEKNLGIVNTRVRNGDTTFIFGLVINEGDITSVNYDAKRNVPAAYLMASIEPFKSLIISGGTRYETAHLYMKNFKDETVDTVYRDWLPSVGLTFSITPDMKVRTAYGRTLARPTERELATYGNFDPAENVDFCGSADLKQTSIHNLDLRWEWYQHTSDLFAASVFYKYLDLPIEKVVFDNNGSITFRNTEKATIAGVELEARFSMERIHKALAGFSVGGNCAFIKSELTIDTTEYKMRKEFDPDTKPTRQLQGQSPWVANAYVIYSSDPLGLNASATFNITGPTILAVSPGDAPDIYSVPHPALNLTLSRKLGAGFSVEVGVRNLFGDRKKAISTFAGNEFVNIEQYKERSYSLKLTYKLQ